MGFPLYRPLINGNYYSFGSIEAQVGALKFLDFTAINYGTSLEVSDVYGTRPQKLGTTRGKQNATASLEMYLFAWQAFMLTLRGGVGYGEVRFPVVISRGEPNVPTITDTLIGCRIVNDEQSDSDGTEPSKVTLTLNVMRLLRGPTGSIVAPIGIGF